MLIEGEGFYHLPIPFIRVVDFVCVGWLVWNVEFGNRRMKFAFFVSIQYIVLKFQQSFVIHAQLLLQSYKT